TERAAPAADRAELVVDRALEPHGEIRPCIAVHPAVREELLRPARDAALGRRRQPWPAAQPVVPRADGTADRVVAVDPDPLVVQPERALELAAGDPGAPVRAEDDRSDDATAATSTRRAEPTNPRDSALVGGDARGRV